MPQCKLPYLSCRRGRLESPGLAVSEPRSRLRTGPTPEWMLIELSSRLRVRLRDLDIFSLDTKQLSL